MTNDDNSSLSPISIEVSAPQYDGQISLSGSLFPDDSIGLINSKVFALESFISLMVKDCKFNDLMREILVIIMNTVKSEAGSILEIDHVNKTLFFRSVVGSRSDTVKNFVIPLGQGIAGYVAESRASLVVDNVPENTVHLKSIEKAVGFETRNIVAVPILIRGRVFGVLELLNRVGEDNFTTSDLELIKYVCEMAAHVIEVRMMMAWSNSKSESSKERGEVA